MKAFPGVALFVERSQARRRDFTLDETNADGIAQICAALEGIPLALELAAAWAALLTPAQILPLLSQRFRLLSAQGAYLPERHRSMQAVLEASYDFLPARLQRFFVRLSVFRGGWTIEAAEAVCEEPDALESIARLQDASLIVSAESGKAFRFRFLETFREFAGERFTIEEREETQRRHADYLVAFAEAAEPHLYGPEQITWLDRLEDETENIRAALQWCQNSEEGGLRGLRLVTALERFWRVRAAQEYMFWIRTALAHPQAQEPTPERAAALIRTAPLAYHYVSWQSDADARARALIEEGIEIYRQSGDALGTARGQRYLAFCLLRRPTKQDISDAEALIATCVPILLESGTADRIHAVLGQAEICEVKGDRAGARRFLEEGLALRRALGDVVGIAYCLNALGDLATAQEDRSAARRFLNEHQEFAAKACDLFRVSIGRLKLACLSEDEGDMDAALTGYQESLRLIAPLGVSVALFDRIAAMARIYGKIGRFEQAARLLGAAFRGYETHFPETPDYIQAWADDEIPRLRALLGDSAFDAAFADGQNTPLKQVIASILGVTTNDSYFTVSPAG